MRCYPAFTDPGFDISRLRCYPATTGALEAVTFEADMMLPASS